MTTFQVLIKSVASVAIDFKSLELVSTDGLPLPGFMAGTNIDIHLSPILVHQYSLCNDQRETGRYVISVKKKATSRGGSQAIHETLKPGDLLTVSAPRDNFALVDGASHSRLVASGITFVLEGIPDHCDMFLNEEEKRAGDPMALCVSRSKSPLLVLDL